MTRNSNYRSVYRLPDGHLRLAFAHLGHFLSVHRISPSVAERRAIENTVQFVISLTIFARRLKGHLERYRPDSWIDVPLYELFLDTQSLFLFVQQFLEDVALILRMAIPKSQRHQMPAAFRHLSQRLRERILAADNPLKKFLDEEATWFNEIGDIRDDICHRTAYDKSRSAVFPELADVLRAGGGIAPFISAADLRLHIGDVFTRTLAFACVAERFIYDEITKQHPQQATTVPPSFIAYEGEIDLVRNDPEPVFPLGSLIMILDKVSVDSLEYFLRSGEEVVSSEVV